MCKKGRLPSHELGSPWYGELTMHMCMMCKLALVTLTRVAKQLRSVKGR